MPDASASGPDAPGATGGCPPDNVCGGRPRDPRVGGKRDPKGGLARPPHPLGSKGRRPLVGIKRGNAPLTSLVRFITAGNLRDEG